jgi:hypothetical protein
VGTDVGTVVDADAVGGTVVDDSVAVGPGVVVVTGVFAHAAKTTPRRRDAARRFMFIYAADCEVG